MVKLCMDRAYFLLLFPSFSFLFIYSCVRPLRRLFMNWLFSLIIVLSLTFWQIGRSFVISKLKDYPQFRAVAIAIRRSGFKVHMSFLKGLIGPLIIMSSSNCRFRLRSVSVIWMLISKKSRSNPAHWFSLIWQIVLLLRLVPLLPFNMLNYLLSVTPVSIWEYMLASWLGMMVSLTLSIYLSSKFWVKLLSWFAMWHRYGPGAPPPPLFFFPFSQLSPGQNHSFDFPCDINMALDCGWGVFRMRFKELFSYPCKSKCYFLLHCSRQRIFWAHLFICLSSTSIPSFLWSNHSHGLPCDIDVVIVFGQGVFMMESEEIFWYPCKRRCHSSFTVVVKE